MYGSLPYIFVTAEYAPSVLAAVLGGDLFAYVTNVKRTLRVR
jgi:hypothetical protein